MVRGLFAVVCAATLVVAACGKSGSAPNPSPPPGAPAAGTPVASAHDGPFFDETLNKPNCMTRRVANGTGTDLMGVRLGMTRDEAVAAVWCDGRQKFNVIASPAYIDLNLHDQKLGPQAFEIKDGVRKPCAPTAADIAWGNDFRCRLGEYRYADISDAISVVTPGLPGQERVMGIWRGEQFKTQPVLTDVEASLVKKFGAPSDSRKDDDRKQQIRWLFDAGGKLVDKDSESFRECSNNFSPQPGRNAQWSESCGLTVVAEITPSSENPALASSYAVGMVDQDALFKLAVSMQRSLDAAHAAQQQQQVDQARAKAPGIKLN